jgi:hypothetical protein
MWRTGDGSDMYGGRSAAGRAQLGVCSLAAGQWRGGVCSAAAGRQQRGQAAGRRQFGCWATTRHRLLDVGRCQGWAAGRRQRCSWVSGRRDWGKL